MGKEPLVIARNRKITKIDFDRPHGKGRPFLFLEFLPLRGLIPRSKTDFEQNLKVKSDGGPRCAKLFN